MALEWRTDKAGDALWDGDTFLGCIYNRDSYNTDQKGWRVLDSELKYVHDVPPGPLLGDARLKAREFLEGVLAPLPTATQLLEQ